MASSSNAVVQQGWELDILGRAIDRVPQMTKKLWGKLVGDRGYLNGPKHSN